MCQTIHNLHYEQIGKEIKCIEDKLPFEIPDSWEWNTIGYVFSLQAGKNIVSSKINESRIKGSYPCFGGNGIRGYVNEKNHNGDYPIIGRQGALCGNIKLASGEFYATEHAVCVSTFAGTNVKWACIFLTALDLNKYATATAQPGLAVANINRVLIPIPPKNEQERIVNKIKELEPLIEKYKQSEEKLYELNSNIKAQLKKSILQYAIEGKLVEQNPNDEPASVLLEKIHAEKEKLIAEGKIKKDKTESVIYRRDNSYYEKQGKNDVCIDEQAPFSIPDSWSWMRFKELVSFKIGKTPERDNDRFWNNGKYPWVSIADLTENGFVNSTKEKITKFALSKKFSDNLIKQGTLLMSFKLTVGKTSILEIDAVHNEAIISITPYFDYDNAIRNYLFYSMPLLSLNGESKKAIKGNTLNSKSLNALLIPVPPIQEQRRIVDMIVRLNNQIG